MKLLTSLLISSLSLTILNAQTTMCFKENHKSMSTIEQTNLDGGECKGSLTVKDMKTNGWNVDDIKINKSDAGFNYIYIFKKENTYNSQRFTSSSDKELEERILSRIKKEEEIKKEIAKKKKIQESITSGKKDYQKKCQNCHGTKGEVLYGSSRAINNFTLDEFKTIMRDYANMTYDRGQGMLMYQYSQTVTTEDIENIHNYLIKINK